MKVGARFSPLRTSLLVSDVGRRQRRADFALRSAVSMALAAAPSIACESMTLPPQSMTAIATMSLLRSAHAMHASDSIRAPALEMTLTSRVSASRDSETSPPFDNCAADGEAVTRVAKSTESPNRQAAVRICLLPSAGSALWHKRDVNVTGVERGLQPPRRHDRAG